ncbi:DUF676-domain-containing protein [Microthyrium microscopicum]|uniref:DUF676-domain-containing protein n=1 Tax=Microthyrium microscopicum TaxID=703497 RepID=A0A6A6UC43_9PEZI|nr:DUF676-domain-containing protein [Microthyrium microscopicum]
MDHDSSTSEVHLCVLIHGLWGNPGHLDFLTSSLRDQFSGEDLHILLPKRNSGNFTYDGIEICGERVTKEIEEEKERLEEKGIKITKISIIGYSLGGLVARYTVGILYHRGFFDDVKPINFTTFATPHLGVRSPLVGVGNVIWNVLGARTLSASGRQMFLIDSFRDTNRPLLSVLADPESIFHRALRSFKNRSLYSNIKNDRTAVFYTTCISATDPFADLSKVNINYLPNTQNLLVDWSNPVSPKSSSKTNSANTSLSTRVLGDIDTKSLFLRARLSLFFTFFLPIGACLYLANAAVQSVRSAQRIRLHTTGKTGIIAQHYNLPLMVETAQRAAEDMFENVNASHAQQFLEDNDDSNDDDPTEEDEELDHNAPTPEEIASQEENALLPAKGVATRRTVGQMEFPTLALTNEQFGMIEGLDKVEFTKYPVHIQEVTHSHAAIIVRMNKESFKEGKFVIKHWLSKFEI